jgi:hypothetical protein
MKSSIAAGEMGTGEFPAETFRLGALMKADVRRRIEQALAGTRGAGELTNP